MSSAPSSQPLLTPKEEDKPDNRPLPLHPTSIQPSLTCIALHRIMSVAAFTPPAASPSRAAAIAAVCERMAAHEAAVAKSNAAASRAWQAELAALRTPPARVVLQTPGVLIRERTHEADDAAHAEEYYRRMATHPLYRQRHAPQPIHQDAPLVPVTAVSDIVALPHRERRHAHGHADVVSEKSPIIPTTETVPAAAAEGAGSDASSVVAGVGSVVTGAAAVAGAPGDVGVQKDVVPVGVQRPSLIDAVARIVQRWVDGLNQGKRRNEEGEQGGSAAAVGAAAQVLAVLFSIGGKQ